MQQTSTNLAKPKQLHYSSISAIKKPIRTLVAAKQEQGISLEVTQKGPVVVSLYPRLKPDDLLKYKHRYFPESMVPND